MEMTLLSYDYARQVFLYILCKQAIKQSFAEKKLPWQNSLEFYEYVLHNIPSRRGIRPHLSAHWLFRVRFEHARIILVHIGELWQKYRIFPVEQLVD